MQQPIPVQLGRAQMLLAYTSAAFGFGTNAMVILLVPFRARELGASLETIGLIVGVGSLVPAVFSVTSGALADRLGSRRTYILSTLLSTVGALLCALSPNYWFLLVLNVLVGIGRNTGWVASQSYITTVGSAQQKAGIMGRFSFSANIGPFVGPVIAGFAAGAIGYRWSFLVVAAITGVFALVGLAMREIDRPSRTVGSPAPGMSSGLGEARSLLHIRGIQVVMLLTIGRLWVSSGWIAFFPLYLLDKGFTPGVIGQVVAANGAASTFISLALGPLSRLAGEVTLTAAALGLSALGMVISPYLAVMPMVFVPSLLMGAGSGITLPLLMTMVGESSPPGRRGVGLGLRNGANSLAGGVAPVTTGALVGVIGLANSLAASGVLTACLIAAALGLHRMRQTPSAEGALTTEPSAPA